MKVSEKIENLKHKKAKIKEMGGKARIETQHKKNKLTARERIDLLFDEGTFREIYMMVKHRCTNFNMPDTEIPTDGVITGHGLVNGRPVYAYAQDFTCRGGSLGEKHAEKIVRTMDLAMKAGVPIIGMSDSGGARVEEGIDSLKGYGDLFFRNSRASGVIPQISLIMGPTAGGSVYSPAMTDFVFMVKGSSFMFITGPSVVKSVTGEETTFEDLGGALTNSTKSGNAHFACESDEDAIEQVKILLSYIPGNNMEDPPVIHMGDDPGRLCPELDTVIPDDPKAAYDMRDVIHPILDHGEFYEIHELFAQNAVIGFGRLNGKAVGIIANQPLVLAGCLDINASDKIARFIRFCDAFNIPLITFVDVPGYLPGCDQEWGGIIRHGAKILWSYCEATVPKFTVTTRKSYGGGYIAMSSQHLGVDTLFAWPSAEIAVMGAPGAVNIVGSYKKEIKESKDPEATRQEKIEEYEKLFNNPYTAAERGYIDAVIQPSETRARLIDALEILCTKKESIPPKKHGNIPL